MVRTYGAPQNFESPWEKAMRNADSQGEEGVHTGKKTYTENPNTKSSLAFEDRHSNGMLPPINNNGAGGREQILREMQHEVYKSVNRNKDKLDNVRREFQLYDPAETGTTSSVATLEILKRFKVPANVTNQRHLVASFTEDGYPAKVNYSKLMHYIEQCKSAIAKEEPKVKSYEITKLDGTCGRFDGTQTTVSERQKEFKPRRSEGIQRRARDQKDSALIQEIQKAFKNRDTKCIDALERTMREKYEGRTVPNSQIKCLADRHNFPLNPALTVKVVETCDTSDIGRIRWESFIEFIRKATGTTSIPLKKLERTSTDRLPVPSWEKKRPLSDIGTTRSTPNHNSPRGYLSDNGADEISDYTLDWNNKSMNNSGMASWNNSMNNSINESAEDTHLQIDEDIEAAFASSIEQLRSSQQTTESSGEQLPDFSSFAGSRAHIYTRLARALDDKAKKTNGVVSCDEVYKLVNYYNLILDANLDDNQVNDAVTSLAQNNEINVQEFCKQFGTKIM